MYLYQLYHHLPVLIFHRSHIVLTKRKSWNLGIDNLNAMCTVPPAYYAHLAAYRARFYMEPDVHEIGKSRGGRSKDESVRPLPALKEKVKNVMFYC